MATFTYQDGSKAEIMPSATWFRYNRHKGTLRLENVFWGDPHGTKRWVLVDGQLDMQLPSLDADGALAWIREFAKQHGISRLEPSPLWDKRDTTWLLY